MSAPVSVPLSTLERAATGRSASMFRDDMAVRDAEIRAAVAGKPALVVGGAGSIGAAVARLLARYRPSHLFVVDQDENGLVELVRNLRNTGAADGIGELKPLALDYGSPLMKRVLDAAPPFALVMNLAAIKHVRSERDLPSILHMLDTNVVKPSRFMGWLASAGFRGAYYAVSTDKAADPANYMGVSKRLQEVLTLQSEIQQRGARATCARFANVAFSNGSLLYGFLRRLERGQPLAVPRRVTRYLITHEEAAQISLLSAVCGPTGHVMVPRLEGYLEPIELAGVAVRVLEAYGLKPVTVKSEAEARERAAHAEPGTWPLLLTEPDTTGEKLDERFVAERERAVEMGLKNLLAIKPEAAPMRELNEVIRGIEGLIRDSTQPADAARLESLVTSIIPEFRHAVSSRSLDGRM